MSMHKLERAVEKKHMSKVCKWIRLQENVVLEITLEKDKCVSTRDQIRVGFFKEKVKYFLFGSLPWFMEALYHRYIIMS